MVYNRYKVYKKQVSTDNGLTWSDVTPLETMPSGSPVASYSTLWECESGEITYRLIVNDNSSSIYTLVCTGTIADNVLGGRDKSSENVPSNLRSSAVSGYVGSCVTELGDGGDISYGVFLNCSALTSVYMPNTVTKYGKSSFYGCSSLTSVPQSTGLTTIGKYAFMNCSSLTSINIPSGVTTIDAQAFWGCSGATSIIWPRVEVDSLGGSIFRNCNGLTSVTIPSNINIGIGTYNDGEEMFEGCKNLSSVTINNSAIGYAQFLGCTNLKNVTISNQCAQIGIEAFKGCTSLGTIDIPNSVYYIGSYAFQNCTSLSSVTIPDSVVTICASTFNNCTSLTSVTIPEYVTTIRDNAFNGCTGLQSITCLASTPPTLYGDYVFDNTNNCLIYVPCDSVSAYETAWSKYASRIQGIVPCQWSDYTWSAIYVGGDTASGKCSTTHSVTRSDILKNKSSSALTEVNIYYCASSIAGRAFSACTNLTKINSNTTGKVVIPDSITGIGGNAFNGCTSLTDIEIGDYYSGINTIGNGAFSDCSGVTSVTINTVTPPTLGTDAFSGLNAHWQLYVPCEAVSAYTTAWTAYANRVQAIPPCNISYLYKATYTDNVTISANCYTSLSNIMDKGNLKDIEIYDCATSIPDSAFTFCRYLSGVTIPNTVTSIGERAFSWMDSLSSITIPNSVDTIGEYAFFANHGLRNITLPSGLTTIDNQVFTSCQSLPLIKSPDSVTSIGNNVFAQCYSLASINIPSGVTNIGRGNSKSCSGLTSITVDSGNTKYDSRNNCNAIIETSNNALIAGCKTTIIPNDVTYIGEEAFQGVGLTSITLPSGLTGMGYWVFADNNSLSSITIPKSLIYVSGYAFENCKNLTRLYIENNSNLTAIQEGAFKGCNLAYVILPASITTIYKDAFKGNTSCQYIMVSSTSVPSLGSGAFDNTNNCTIYVPSVSVNAYKSASGWSSYASRIRAIP